jgi:hypothetical protein
MSSPSRSIHLVFEARFARWGRVVGRRAPWIILATLVLTGALASQLGQLGMDASTEGFLRPDNPARVAYDEFRERFGRDQVIVVAVEPPEIFDTLFLRRLRDFHEALEDEVPMLEEVRSLANARATYGQENVLIVADLLDEIPETPAELAAFRKRVMESPSYRGLMISEDATLTTLVIETDAYSRVGLETEGLGGFGESDAPGGPRPFISAEEEVAIVEAVHAVIARFEGPEFRVQLGGNVLFPIVIQAAMQREMPRFVLASLLIMSGLLFVLFRRVSAVLLPLLVVVLALVAALSLMAVVGIDIKMTTQVVPTFLLAVGIGHTVHLLNSFYMRLDEGASREEAVVEALAHAGLPILMTGITTMVGVLSFTTAEMAPIADFGIVTAAGVALTLLYSLIFLPALLARVPIRARAAKLREGEHRGSALLAACGRLATRRPWLLVGITAALMILSLAAIPNISFSANPLTMLPEEHPLRVATAELDARMGGSVSFEVWVETDREDALKDPVVLQKMQAIENRVAEYIDGGETLGRTISLLDVSRETHQALNENRTAFYVIPDEPRLLAQELLLFENSGSDDLERLVDAPFSQARMTVRAEFIEPMDRAAFLERAEIEFRQIMGDVARVQITGFVDIMSYTATATVRSMVSSYGLAFLLITPLMILMIGSLRAGLVSMIPNLVPILLTLALMIALGIPVDGFTLLVGCIAVGLAVDDTIHLIHGYRRELARGADPATAIDRTLQTTGRALLFTSIILCSGFVVFALSSMNNLINFGMLISFAIAAALVLDILVTPALLILVTKRAPSEPIPADRTPSSGSAPRQA